MMLLKLRFIRRNFAMSLTGRRRAMCSHSWSGSAASVPMNPLGTWPVSLPDTISFFSSENWSASDRLSQSGCSAAISVRCGRVGCGRMGKTARPFLNTIILITAETSIPAVMATCKQATQSGWLGAGYITLYNSNRLKGDAFRQRISDSPSFEIVNIFFGRKIQRTSSLPGAFWQPWQTNQKTTKSCQKDLFQKFHFIQTKFRETPRNASACKPNCTKCEYLSTQQ